MAFAEGLIDGVQVRELVRYTDDRGWLIELFRADGVDGDICPVMGYVSVTHPGITRGPHEHRDQGDWFCFLGPSDFLLVLWDNRADSPTYCNRMRMVVGGSRAVSVVVPKGVVHGYRNVGAVEGMVVNLPNRLYRGNGATGEVDEIRHELDSNSGFDMDAI
ncbi:MAG: dTDP-4-dehydrorhamnose 3,5-epimerase family protein [Polyangiaceae bacterium]|nr:dTDP-4-dehydrorhamnose 3,5-epimerase family protein [Polyangiaceae bacterium]